MPLSSQNKGLTNQDFELIRSFIYKNCGINLTPIKKTMVQSRLFKLVNKSQFDSYSDYLDYALHSEEGKNDLINLIDVITTNKTDFFREPAHFNFLVEKWLPKLVASGKKVNFNVWSAGCSIGAEAFTTAMVLEEFKEKHSNFDYNILATDISSKVLMEAKRAVYPLGMVEVVPLYLKRKYMLKSKNSGEDLVRFIPYLRNKIEVKYLNFMDNEYNVRQKYDLIFCRNVLIYFDQETKNKIVGKLYEKLVHGGLLFIGHSESIFNFNKPLKQLQPSVFLKAD